MWLLSLSVVALAASHGCGGGASQGPSTAGSAGLSTAGSGGSGTGGHAGSARAAGAAGETACSAAGASTGCEEASVDASGNDIVSADGALTVSIPAGALDVGVSITIQTVAAGIAGAVGNVYELGPEGITFKKPIALTLKTPTDASIGDFRRLRMANLVGDAWQPLSVQWIEYNGPSIGGLTTHFSKYALTAEAETVACQCGPENKSCCVAGMFDEKTCSCSVAGYYDDAASCALWWSKNYEFVWNDQDCLAQTIDWDLTACSEDWRQCCREAGGVGPLFNGTTTDTVLVAPQAKRCVCDLGCGDSKTAEASFLGCVREKVAYGKTLANPDAICAPPGDNEGGAPGAGGSGELPSSGGSQNGSGGGQNGGSGGGGANGSGGGSGVPPTCSNGLQACTDAATGVTACFDLINDVEHCGSCDEACGAGNHCSQGICCAPQEQACFDAASGMQRCYDLSQSHDHCGACLNACAQNEECLGRACTCKSPLKKCSGSCVDVNGDDPQNCGDCGHTCTNPPPDDCADATTVRAYTGPGACESGHCDGYASSESACPADEACSAGVCVPCSPAYSYYYACLGTTITGSTVAEVAAEMIATNNAFGGGGCSDASCPAVNGAPNGLELLSVDEANLTFTYQSECTHAIATEPVSPSCAPIP